MTDGAWHDEWRVTGDPTVTHRGIEHAYPWYDFTYDSRDDRWPGEQAEAQARTWLAAIEARSGDNMAWRIGPHLHHRRVFTGNWEDAG